MLPLLFLVVAACAQAPQPCAHSPLGRHISECRVSYDNGARRNGLRDYSIGGNYLDRSWTRSVLTRNGVIVGYANGNGFFGEGWR